MYAIDMKLILGNVFVPSFIEWVNTRLMIDIIIATAVKERRFHFLRSPYTFSGVSIPSDVALPV